MRSPVAVHRHLALIHCDSPGSLAEVLAHVDIDEIPHVRFGDRAIALPVDHVAALREALWEAGTFPRIVGDVTTSAAALAAIQEEE